MVQLLGFRKEQNGGLHRWIATIAGFRTIKVEAFQLLKRFLNYVPFIQMCPGSRRKRERPAPSWTLGRCYRVVSEGSKVAFIIQATFYRKHNILISVIRLRFAHSLHSAIVRDQTNRVGSNSIKRSGLMGGWPPQRPPLTHYGEWGALRAFFPLWDGK